MMTTNFSIDYILNRAGEQYIGTNASVSLKQRVHGFHPYAFGRDPPVASASDQHESISHAQMYDWLQYTRYHPPKLPRSMRNGPAKRTPGRLPRIPFTPAQLEALEAAYRNSNYLSAEDANKLAQSLDLTNTRVKIWFQNRRARERRERREKEESYDSSASFPSSPEPLDESFVVVV